MEDASDRSSSYSPREQDNGGGISVLTTGIFLLISLSNNNLEPYRTDGFELDGKE
jgi:hypothetical protein